MRKHSPIRASGLFFAAMYLVLITEPSFALQDGLARTPPMGWNDWYVYECDLINESVVLGAIAAFTKKHPPNWEGKQISLKDAGYSYLCIDDCWGIGTRNAAGNLQINTVKFPRSAGTNSFKWLGDILHSQGLKFGMYTSDGTRTCAKDGQVQPGSCNHEDVDAAQFASWGVDFLKDDCCWAEVCPPKKDNYTKNKALYFKMAAAIKKTGRPMVLSLCELGNSSPWTYGDSIAHMWRTNIDFDAPGWQNVMNHADQNLSKSLHLYSKPGAWNDPDIMQIAVGSLTTEENRSHFSLWCIMAAPLMLGNELVAITDTVFSIVTNREAIAVNQDSLGVEGHRVRQIGVNNIDIHVKQMTRTIDNCRRFAVLVLNRTTGTQSAAVKWSDFGETNTKAAFTVRDLWKHQDIATYERPANDSVRVTMPGHGCAFLLLTKVIPDPSDAIENVVPGKNPSTYLTTRRCASRGLEVFIPDANSNVQIFNVQGKQTASFSVPHPSWYRINDIVSAHGIFIVRAKPLNGLPAKELRLVR